MASDAGKLNFLRLPLQPRPASRARCADLCLFFALPQRIGEEKALKGLMPLRNPQSLLLDATAARGGYGASDAEKK